MTPAGAYPPPRAGEAISTAAELDGLPVGSRVGCKGIRTWKRGPDLWWKSPEHPYAENSAALFRGHGGCPLTVLFRPDAAYIARGDA